MQNRTIGIIATVITALVCVCAALFACGFGFPIAMGNPVTTTVNGQATQQTLPATIGYVLLCLSLLMLLIPVAVGFFTLRKKPEASSVPNINEPMPPAS
jgi:hypothetical protein